MSVTCDPRAAFVVCGPVSAGNRMTAAVLVRGGCSGEATAWHEWAYNSRMPEGPDVDPLPCLIRHAPFDGYPSVDDRLRASGYSPTYIYAVRDRTANTASAIRLGYDAARLRSDVARRTLLGALRADSFELFPVESLMLGGNAAAAALCARHGLDTSTRAPIIVDRIERSFDNTDWKYWQLSWRGDHGFYPVDPRQWPYDCAYFDKYLGYAETEMGRALTRARLDLVRRYWDGPILDFGIGCGAFVEAHGNAKGFDVNPAAVDWLLERGRFDDPWRDGFRANVMTFWDSLEHVLEIDRLLDRVDRYAFVSIPIFDSYGDVCASRHFRIDEHYWYFTHNGFIRYMRERGFSLIHANSMETRLGRESIETFVFERVQKSGD